MQEELKKIGLTDNETKAYITLSELGEVTIGPLTKTLNWHRQVAYDVLASLINKQLVEKIIKGKTMHFRISNPDNIMRNIKKLEATAEILIKEIKAKTKGQKRGQEIRVYEGAKAFREFVLEYDYLMPPNSITLAISNSNTAYAEIMGRSFQTSVKIRHKKNINSRLIFPEQERKNLINFARKPSELRFIPQEHNPPTAFQVFHDCVILASYGPDVFFIQIKNENFRQTYINYFNHLWRLAKK